MPRAAQRLVPLLIALLLACSSSAAEQTSGEPHKPKPKAELELVVLGDAGGLDEAALTSLLVRDVRDDRYALVDAGTVHAGLRVAYRKGAFAHVRVPKDADARPIVWLQRQRIGPVLITHPHLDHVSGLAITSPDDAKHPLYGLPSTIEGLRDSVFNWTAWPNFGSEGKGPLAKYRYHRLAVGEQVALEGTRLKATAWPLSHGGMTSTAFLIEGEQRSIAVLGDTGPDDVEKGGRLALLWERLAPQVRDGRLKAIAMEASYPNGRADELLFGHLTPKWLLHELTRLATMVHPSAPNKALRGLTLVVMHIKPSTTKGKAARETIAEQLNAANDLGVTFVLPRAGDTVRVP